jgi:hypothetical protein
MVKYGVLFEVRTGFLNVIYSSFGCLPSHLESTLTVYNIPSDIKSIIF